MIYFILLPVEKTFSRIHDNVELSLSSLFIGAKSFSQHALTSDLRFHFKMSDGGAFDLITGKSFSPNVENVASLALEANVPRNDRCFDTN